MLLPDDAAPSQDLRAVQTRAAFFEFDGEAWTPNEPGRSPWNPKHTGGVPTAALLMHAADQVPSQAPMLPAHITIDILRPVPYGPIRTRGVVTREGRKMQMVESHLLSADGETVARARIMRTRLMDTPLVAAQPVRHPGPDEAVLQPPPEPPRTMSTIIETRKFLMPEGAPSGVMWARMVGDLAPGIPVGDTGRLAMFADFGTGLAPLPNRDDWTFANVDISVHLARLPVGEWILVDAESLLQGAGIGLTSMVMADVHGEFGRAHQTLFIDRPPGWKP